MLLWLWLHLRDDLPMRRRSLRLRVWVRVAYLTTRPAGAGLDRPLQVSYPTAVSHPTEPLLPESAERDANAPDMFRMLLDNHARFLGFLERRVGSRDDAEDILQEAFVRSIGRTDALRTSESATAWFYRVSAMLSLTITAAKAPEPGVR